MVWIEEKDGTHATAMRCEVPDNHERGSAQNAALLSCAALKRKRDDMLNKNGGGGHEHRQSTEIGVLRTNRRVLLSNEFLRTTHRPSCSSGTAQSSNGPEPCTKMIKGRERTNISSKAKTDRQIAPLPSRAREETPTKMLVDPPSLPRRSPRFTYSKEFRDIIDFLELNGTRDISRTTLLWTPVRLQRHYDMSLQLLEKLRKEILERSKIYGYVDSRGYPMDFNTKELFGDLSGRIKPKTRSDLLKETEFYLLTCKKLLKMRDGLPASLSSIPVVPMPPHELDKRFLPYGQDAEVDSRDPFQDDGELPWKVKSALGTGPMIAAAGWARCAEGKAKARAEIEVHTRGNSRAGGRTNTQGRGKGDDSKTSDVCNRTQELKKERKGQRTVEGITDPL
ncbi:hypothetical protein BT69DRAFT_1317739 [Atractiella rhizophila]|nr:hypothetical protein BT69DRAFT_1317739 [Atractiella rhizophila]